MAFGVESEQDTETVIVKHSEIAETVDRDDFVVLLPCTVDAVNGYFTNETAPICYKKLGEKPFEGISFRIKINRGFSDFTYKQKLEAVGRIVSEWRPKERISLTLNNFTKEQFDEFVQAYLESKQS